jgi:sugar-specific transcriptional regulator TrmB
MLASIMALEKLRKIGMSDGEIKVYSALLDKGTASVNDLQENLGIDRRNIYDILNKLIERGLVSYVDDNKRKRFSALNPKRIVNYIEEKEVDLNNVKTEIQLIIPELVKRFESEKSKLNASVYRGKEGIKAIFDDMLNYRENFFIGSGGYVAINLPYFWQEYNRRRIKKGVRWYNLCRGELREKIKTTGKYIYNRYMPLEFSANPSVVFIYGDKLANVLWDKDFFAFVIESKEIASNYKKYHEFIWKRSKK